MLARSGATLPLAAGTGPVAALAGPRGCAETGLSRGGAASTVAARVSAGLVADEAGVQRLSDHSPKTSPSSWIAEAVLAFPLPLLFQARADFFSCPGGGRTPVLQAGSGSLGGK